MQSLSLLQEQIAQCRRCLDGVDLLPCTPGTRIASTRRPSLLVLADAPTDVESMTQKPWSSPSGLHLRRLLLEADIATDLCWFSYFIRCPKWVGRQKACSDWLKVELATVKPRVVLTLGKRPFQALLGKKSSFQDSLFQCLVPDHGQFEVAVLEHTQSIYLSGKVIQDRILVLLRHVQGLLACSPG